MRTRAMCMAPIAATIIDERSGCDSPCQLHKPLQFAVRAYIMPPFAVSPVVAGRSPFFPRMNL
ncbi:hypothetical protein SAMN02927929_02426 [Pseudomonas flexibilis]|uniref:Uncharacterized protein n=1 Tax=Pseudomonas flexibilis TaxID=706570 RepID=A0A1N7AKF7_9PSED|nr:hypothetical protein SAMN02927929_02426 [Pseudomonas flexibilis]SIR39620.1 hypothetical protein SAMN05421672_1228 [Pseudomonas flexibilis]